MPFQLLAFHLPNDNIPKPQQKPHKLKTPTPL